MPAERLKPQPTLVVAPRWRLDASALALLIAGLWLAANVFQLDSAGDDSKLSRLDPVGGWLAELMVETFGFSVYVVLAGWFVLVLMLFSRKRWLVWSMRLSGWVVLVPSLAAIGDCLAPEFPGSPLAGSGGTLGAFLTQWLEAHLSFGSRVLLLSGLLTLGLAMSLSFTLAWVKIVFRTTILLPLRWWPTGRRAPIVESAETPHVEPPLVPVVGKAKTDSTIPINHPGLASSENKALAVPRLLSVVRPSAQTSEEERFADFELPPLTLLEEPQPFPYAAHDQQLRETAALLEKTFTDFELKVRVVGINTGPVITQFELALDTGLRVNKVTGLSDDLALNLKVPSVRIVAPIPGKNTVGVEIPNEHRAIVRLKEVILAFGDKLAKSKIPLFLGKDTEGKPLVYDLAEMPHLLIAGRTGTGKSVCMNAIILSILMTRRPDEVKMIMIDPKMLEMSEYGKIPHLMHPVVKDMKKAEAILSWAVDKMEERYDLLSRVRVRNIAGYNDLELTEIHRRLGEIDEEERKRIPDKMPYIVIFIDEMADLMMTMKKEVEGHIIRLAQKSRAAGIHLVVATQKPTVDVITGLIKSNLPSRICFQVTSRSDSRVVLDEMGADKLLGKGDMLFLPPGTSSLIRAQGAYASDQEITRVVENLECDPCYAAELVQLSSSDSKGGEGGVLERMRSRDELYEQAIEVIVREGRGSVSLLQRALGIGYGRAARLVDFMAEDGIVGSYNGSSAREVLYTPEQWAQLKAG